jgi:trehalose utilization protein
VTVGWEQIKRAASEIFDVWTTHGDLTFAREAWGHVEAAGLAEDYSLLDQTQSYLRVIVLRQIYGDFCRLKWEESGDTEVTWCADALRIDPLALGILAAEHLGDDAFRHEKSSEMREDALLTVCDALRDEVFQCLHRAYGGDKGLYCRLSVSSTDDDEETISDLILTANDITAFEFVSNGGRN